MAAAAWSWVEKMLHSPSGLQLDQRFDEHRGLNGHVQGAGDADAFSRTLGCVAGTNGHEARHFMLSNADFKPAKVREGFVGDQIRRRGAGLHGLRAQPCLKGFLGAVA